MARRLVVQPQSDLDIQAAAVWYEDQRSGLGVRFLDELDLVFQRITDNPRQFPPVEGDVHRALLNHFPAACISSQSQRTSEFWRFCTCIENLTCGRAVIDDFATS
jgi:hypothetical protein